MVKKVLFALFLSSSLLFTNFIDLYAQSRNVTVSGLVREQGTRVPMQFVNIVLLNAPDSVFVTGTISNPQGSFSIQDVSSGDYFVQFSFLGYETAMVPLHVGRLSNFLDMGNVYLRQSTEHLDEVTVTAARQEVSTAMDRKVYSMEDNVTQAGGSVLQALQNLPGITVDQDGKLYLRGSDKVTILLDGKQTAITGLGTQAGLENLPASAIESIEIINNPSARYDASGMAGIVNIIFKKQQDTGFNGRAGLTMGVGALGIKRENMPGIRNQYRFNPKVNPSLSVNYKKDKVNLFFMGDLLYHKTMMRNEFFERIYDNGERIKQQFLENRTQPIYNLKTGIDWNPAKNHSISFSGLYNYRAYTDLGDLPYDNAITGVRNRLWQYYEKEVNQTLFLTLTHKYAFTQPGHELTSSLNYSFRRKDEIFYFDNILPTMAGTDTTALLADENIYDLTVDYVKPLRSGRLELGTKQRARIFPNDIWFTPGQNSILDPGLAGTAEYREWLSALYGNYVYEFSAFEVEAGLRLEYAKIDYLVDPNHSVYKSDGFSYFNPFPTLRATWLMNSSNRLTLFYNRRVDRPEESSLRVFPTYADPEILRIGNPTLEPQFTQSAELSYRRSWSAGYLYGAVYLRASTNLLTTIITEVPGSNRLTSVNQNAGNGTNTGVEWVFSQQIGSGFRLNFNANAYQNVIGAFSIVNAYPGDITFSREENSQWSGNAKLNLVKRLPRNFELQLNGTYLFPDIVPQGKILARGSVDAALSKEVQNGRGEFFINASDIFNTMVMKYELEGNGFRVNSKDFYETQVVRIGYQFRF